MLRSLYSGVSGLRSHQTKMDVIGNNIANVNTTAFKSSRVTFKDVYYQTMSNAAANTDIKGGSNPKRIGYGSTVSSIDVVNTRGGYQTTDRTLDLYLDGEGYFVVQDEAGNVSYTRCGNFSFDVQGALVDPNGNYVGGGTPEYSEGSDTEPIIIDNIDEYTDIAIDRDGKITGVLDGNVETLGQIAVAKFKNPEGLSQQGGIYFKETKNSGEPTLTYPGGSATGTVVSGGLEMSNVDLSKELTDMITTERGFQANSRVITVSDEMLQELVNIKR